MLELMYNLSIFKKYKGYELRIFIKNFLKTNPTYYGYISIYHNFFKIGEVMCKCSEIIYFEWASPRCLKYQNDSLRHIKLSKQNLDYNIKVWV